MDLNLKQYIEPLIWNISWWKEMVPIALKTRYELSARLPDQPTS